ncbi:putative TcdC-like protein [Bifidobacterium magnum]|uniref:Putative TcdC-like protein n=1 Tax=Bifidobacterium magnum TaxID=1692 RepID=A0A087B9A0_9BIFI|nr:putative TcdC-like protein [Bifidobacterium magnum]
MRAIFSATDKRVRSLLVIVSGLLVTFLVATIILGCSLVSRNHQIAQLESTVEGHVSTIAELNESKVQQDTQIKDLSLELDELKNGKDKMLVDVRNAYDQKDWEQTITAADALHDKYNGSEQDKEGQKLKAEAQKKIDEAKAAEKKKQEEEAARKAEEEARGYETGITYEQIARQPDEYKGKKVKFYGKVIQVLNSADSDSVTIRLIVDDDYDQVIMGMYAKNIVPTRVLEDDHITIYGTFIEEYTYTAVLGNSVTVPLINIAKIDQ